MVFDCGSDEGFSFTFTFYPLGGGGWALALGRVLHIGATSWYKWVSRPACSRAKPSGHNVDQFAPSISKRWMEDVRLQVLRRKLTFSSW